MAETSRLKRHLQDEGHAHALATKPDVLLVASYHRILPEPLRAAAKHALNIHPALLPRYRGPNPFYWVLRNGETRTGVTVHALTSDVDAGEIYWQRDYAIAPADRQILRAPLNSSRDVQITALPG